MLELLSMAATGLVHVCLSGAGFSTEPGNTCEERGWIRPTAEAAILSCTASDPADCTWFDPDLVFRTWGDLPSTTLIQACMRDIPAGPFPQAGVDPCGSGGDGMKPWIIKADVQLQSEPPVFEMDPGDASLSWNHPTQRVDGSALALSEILNTMILWGLAETADELLASPNSIIVDAPADDAFVDELPIGRVCFIARTSDTNGLTSDPSNVACKDILSGPASPEFLGIPAEPLVVVDSRAYRMTTLPDRPDLTRIGDIPEGTDCIMTEALVVNGDLLFAVPSDEVVYPPAIETRFDLVFARCGR